MGYDVYDTKYGLSVYWRWVGSYIAITLSGEGQALGFCLDLTRAATASNSKAYASPALGIRKK